MLTANICQFSNLKVFNLLAKSSVEKVSRTLNLNILIPNIFIVSSLQLFIIYMSVCRVTHKG